jgi:hypothetical protein
MTSDMITWVSGDYDDISTISSEYDKSNGKLLVKNTIDGQVFYQYYINDYSDRLNSFTQALYSVKTILAEGVVCRTSLIQDTESKLEDYIYEMDRYYILDAGTSIYEIIYDRAYDIAEEILLKALEEDYALMDERDKSDVVEEMVNCIEFESLYEIVDEILHAPRTMEEKLADVGMSIHDFI